VYPDKNLTHIQIHKEIKVLLFYFIELKLEYNNFSKQQTNQICFTSVILVNNIQIKETL
jgi:hypothetical protein